MTNHTKGLLALITITLLWGLTFPLINLIANDISANLFVFSRFIIAAVLLLPIYWRNRHQQSKRLLGYGLLLGVLTMLTFVSQTLGLRTLDPASSAFITGLSVIIVPFIAPFFAYPKPSIKALACAIICALGLYFLTGAKLTRFSPGVMLTLVCAISYAFYIVVLQRITENTEHHDLLAFNQILCAGLLAGGMSFIEPPHIHLTLTLIIAILFCGVMATALILILQTRYQRHIPANQVALIFTLEPVFASIFSYFIVGEHFYWNFYLGAGLIFAAIITSELISTSTT